MSISVVLPAYNAERYLDAAIQSVLAQTVGDWELVIVDDGSSDQTAALARSYSERDTRIRALHQGNSGVAAARNRGFAESDPSRGYVIFLDADDVWEKNALEVLVSTLEADPHAVAANGLSRMIDAGGCPCEPGELEMWGRTRWGVRGKRLEAWPIHAPTTLEVLAVRNCIYTTGQALVRRSVLNDTGQFDPFSCPCEDWDMWLRLSLRGYIAFTDRVILSWRRHDKNMSGQGELAQHQAHYVRRNLLASSEMNAEQRRIARTANWLRGRHVCSERLRRAKARLAQRRLRDGLRLLGHAMSGYAVCMRGIPVP